jgi:hypothetical protein
VISSLNPRNLKGIERNIFDHQLIYLNPNYKGKDTPANYRDWLDLIYESIHSPENPHINRENPGIRRASELLEYDNLTGEEIRLAKLEVMREHSNLVREEDRVFRVALKMIAEGFTNDIIARMTDLDDEMIDILRKSGEE